MPVYKDYVTVDDGTKIEILLVTPQQKPRALVQLQGGAGLSKEFYEHFAEYLAETGFAVVLLDYRGIGGSTGPFLSTREADLMDWARLDMTGVLRWASGKFPGIPRFIIGHSMGGILTGFVKDLTAVDGLVLLCACSGNWRRMTFPYRLLPGFVFNFYIPLIARFSHRIPLRFSGVMDDLPRGVGRMWGDLSCEPEYLKKRIATGDTNYDKYRGPLLSLMIADDPIATESTARELHDFFALAKGKFLKITPRDLGQGKIGHFGLFSRRFKDTLWADIARWLEDKISTGHIKNQPSP